MLSEEVLTLKVIIYYIHHENDDVRGGSKFNKTTTMCVEGNRSK